MEKHYLEKELESLNNVLLDLIKESRENNYYEKKNLVEYNYCLKKLEQILFNAHWELVKAVSNKGV